MDRRKLESDEIFCAAIELASAAERAAYLDQVCGDDLEIRRRIERLLEAHFQAGSFLSARPAIVAITTDSLTESSGTVIGRYKLLQLIGEGGMGAVWMAEQTQPVQRKVALKIIKAGMDSRHVLARFEAERQALALMDHPNIAKVLDGGATATGRPFFVMELVKGQPITQYCDQHRLTPRQRLELFVHVCQALQHAHQKGIIHRDIKPSNILVANLEGKPVVKVIDFGVAKATGQRLTEKTLFTELGAVVGTLEYMSPEQAELNNQDIDTRSDIYTLGVVLYELLTGSTPLIRQQLKKKAFNEMLQMIREEEPPKPSTRLSDSKDSLPSISAQRQMEPAKLMKLVKGELDWIVMTALEKDRNRRYETANGLARDIERYLHDEPVQACPPSAGYRVRKFVRRHKGSVVAACTVLFALLAATVLSVFWARREQAVRSEAVEAKQASDAARLEAVEAEQATDAARREAEENLRHARRAVDEMYTQVAKKWLAQQPQMESVQQEFLKKALAFYEKFSRTSSADPAIRFETAQAYARVAEIQHKLGESAPAEKAYKEAVDLLQRLVDECPDRPEYQQELANALSKLGELLGDTFHGHPEEPKIYRRALQLHRKLVKDYPTDAAYRRDLARCLYTFDFNSHYNVSANEVAGLIDEAIALQRQLVAEQPAAPEIRRELAASLRTKSRHLATDGRRQLVREALDLFDKLVTDFPSDPNYREELGETYRDVALISPFPDAEKSYHKAIDAFQKLVADFPSVKNYRSGLALCYHHLGEALSGTGKSADAEKAFRLALTVGEELRTVPKVEYFRTRLAKTHIALAELLVTCKRFSEADKEFQHAIALFKNILAENPTISYLLNFVATTQERRANVLAKAGQSEEAEKARREALEEAIAAYSKLIELEPNNVLALNNLAWRLATHADPNRRDPARALTLAKKAVELAPAEGGNWNTLGAVHYRAEDWKACIAALEKSMELRHGGDSADWFFLAMAHWKLGRQELARRWFDLAVWWIEKNQPSNDELRRFRAEAAGVLGASEKSDAGQTPAQYDETEVFTLVLDVNPRATWAYIRRAAAHFGRNRWKEAIADYSTVIEMEPKNADAWHQRAHVHERLQQWDQAFTDFSKSIELSPQQQGYYRCRANAYLKLGREESVRDYSKAIELEPKSAEAWHERGYAHAVLAQWDRAAADSVQAVELNGNNPLWWEERVAYHLQAGGDDTAYRTACEQILERFGRTENLLSAQRAALSCLLIPQAVKNEKLVLQLAEQSATRAPKFEWCLITKGVALYRAGQFEAAVRHLEQTLKKWPEDPYAAPGTDGGPLLTWLVLAMAHHRLGHTEEARRWLDKAVQRMDKESAAKDIGLLRRQSHDWARCLILRREAQGLLK